MQGYCMENKLSLFDLVLFGLGNVVGAGVFVIIAKSIKHGGNNALPALFLVSVLSLIMGFCYIEIYNRHPSSITEYLAVNDTLGDTAGQIMLYAIYMFALLSGVTIVTGITKYISPPSHIGHKTLSIAILALIAFINSLGIETSKIVANTISLVMLAVLGGAIWLSYPKIDFEKAVSAGGEKLGQNFILSAALSLFLFNGYDFLVKISDESANKDDNKVALTVVLILTAILYLFIMLSGISVLGFNAAANSQNLITQLFSALTSSHISSAVFMSGAFIMFNTAFLSVMSGTKFLQGLGNKDKIPFAKWFSETNSRGAPTNAILVSLAICVVFALFNNVSLLALFANFTGIATLILISVAVLIYRWRDKDDIKSQLKHNVFKWDNVHNIPVSVVAGLGALFVLFWNMIKNGFWIDHV
jgi:amino acid transporter